MSALSTISLEQYLQTSHEPECELIDGELVPKAMGTAPHSILQSWLVYLLVAKFGPFRVRTEQSIRLSDRMVLIPDVCVLRPGALREGLLVVDPPSLCIEILSPSDRFSAAEKKCRIYLEWGVGVCWIFAPDSKKVWEVSADGGTVLRTELSIESLSIPLSRAFPPEDGLVESI